ncbi:litaf-like zinc finger domain-containing protein [Fusarium flagelliforme]|uniref:Litaf-like zinc finger domain-containing protein n=1 Tax=Fusarium flagelliforme TaxID=2675880 RepID=A0A395MEG5_9HYPO|nr:litaf-like zinc finger domain-containing protein [Fusarium flagelliforme]
MEKPTATPNNYSHPQQGYYPEQSQQHPEQVHYPDRTQQQQPPQYENHNMGSSPLAQPPLTHQHDQQDRNFNPHQQPPQGQQQGGFPPAQSQNYQSMPIQNLQSQSAPVVCPSCGVRAMTVTKAESGGMMHAVAAGVCFFTCLGCIPYCISSLKDVHHQCGNCNMPLADYHRSGRTEVRCFQK